MAISTDMLAAFAQVAEHLSVSAAAVDLGVGKSVVSKRIAQLEAAVKATLFSRSTRKVVLTPAGEAYLEFARRALAEVAQAQERLRDLRTELTGQIRRHAIGSAALNDAEQGSLGPLLARLTAAITLATGAEKVYVVAFGEAFPHWHFLLMARGKDVEVAHRGAALMLHREQYIDRAAALAAADNVRGALSSRL